MPSDSQRLARSVVRLARRLRQERNTELTPTQLAVLGTVMVMGPATPSAIAARENVRPPSVTRTLNCLADDGYIVREPHPDDGRQVLVRLSDKGELLLTEQRNRRNAWLDGRLSTLTVAERATLRDASDLLERLAAE
ncbi:MarR family winged helix-turn-helix transcriptional regulator [Aeromicrobium sp.]|jgi:DNA-binding MarR family transcriptional regulator|uniref:MarR family winged helix-turn-helix transcriptional regulator n=1 Tax=Aeromicrobium sp. TaxID=1871063 RepID=UPI003C579405